MSVSPPPHTPFAAWRFSTPFWAWCVRGACLMLLALPVAFAVGASLRPAVGSAPWATLWASPGLLHSLAISVATALGSTLLAGALAWHLAARWMLPRSAGPLVRERQRAGTATDAQSWLGPMLAMPHAAFAVGLMLLLAPAGWLTRVLAWPLGWTEPPTSGLLVDSPLPLVAVLVLKEVPFLLWSVLSSLRQPDALLVLHAADRQARLLGHGAHVRWWLVHAPMHAHRLGWPLLAVLAYGLAVVDVPLVTGPTLPPPMSVVAWEGMVDASPSRQDAGAAAAWLLALCLLAMAVTARRLKPLLAHAMAQAASRGPRAWAGDIASKGHTRSVQNHSRARGVWHALVAAYACVGMAMVFASFAGPWPFPQWAPQAWSTVAWLGLLDGAPRIAYSFGLAAISASLSVMLAVGWLACTPARWDRAAITAAMLTVLLPSMLLSFGLYEGSLRLGLDATHVGLLWAHVLFAHAYALLLLTGPWRGLDRKYIDIARVLGHGPWSRLLRVQIPLLRTPLASAWAVAFAVSIAQYLPTQLIGAGRITTLATDVVTRAASGQRNVAAAVALMLALLPCLVFVMAARRGAHVRKSAS